MAAVLSIGLAAVPLTTWFQPTEVTVAIPRGRIVRAVRPVFTAGGKEIAGRKLILTCYVKTGSRRMRDQFEQAIHHLGLTVKLVQDVFVQEAEGADGYLSAYEVIGTPNSLEQFTAKACVKDWEYPLNVVVPHVGTGSGDKPRRQLHPLTQRLMASVERQDTIEENRRKLKHMFRTL
jgi:hypothetical protein